MYKALRAMQQQKLALLHAALNVSHPPCVVCPDVTSTSLTFPTTTTTDLHQETHSNSSSSRFLQNQARSESHQQHYHGAPLGALSSGSPPVPAAAAAVTAAVGPGDCCSFSFSGQTCVSPQGSALPRLLVEFLRCELDEVQVQAEITGRLRQVQAGQGEGGGHGEGGLMYLMVDQMLFYIVEWARGSVFFNELKVNNHLTWS